MDASRFAELYEPLCRDLYRFALYTMGNPAEAEDAVGESVLAAWEKRDQLRDESAFRAWLFQITANTCRRRLKRSARAVPTEGGALEGLAEADTEAAARPLAAADAAAVRDLFGRLAAEDRVIVALSVFGGYRSGEIGELIDMNANTVRSRRKRALDWMAAQWKGAR